MGEKLPDRHPNKDFFILDLKDAQPKDDIASMEHPVFSLAMKPDMRSLSYQAPNGDTLEVHPSGYGLATIMDKDILLYCISKLVHQKNEGRIITPVVEMTAHEVMVACNWLTSGDSYQRFEAAMFRLRGTTLKTNIKTGGTQTTSIFGLVDEADLVRYDANGEASAFGRMSRVRITLSDWTFRAVESLEVLTISRDYFRLRRPLERRLYEIARKHGGNKTDAWKISIERLREKVGTSAPLKKFRFNLKEIITDGNIPDYGFLLDGDTVIVQRLVSPEELAALPSAASYIPLRPDTIDKAQVIAAGIGVSVFDLEREWNEWVKAKDLAPPENADAAFIAFVKQKQASQPARRVVAARSRLRDQQH
jgi:Replication initiator protein A